MTLSRAEAKRLIEQTLLSTEARTALRKIAEGLQDNIDAGGGGGGPVGRCIGAQLLTANSATLLVGTYIDIPIPFDLTLSATDQWLIRAPNAGSAVVDVRRATVAAPNTFASIAASAKPTLSSDDYARGAMTGYPTSILAGETIRFIVESASGFDRVQVFIPVSTA